MKNAKGFQDMFRVYGENSKKVLDGYTKRESYRQIGFKKGFDLSQFSDWPEAQKREYLSSSLLVPMDLLQQNLTPSAVILYSLICEDAVEENGEFVFRTSQSYFKGRLNFNRLTITRTLNRLEEAGLIKKDVDLNQASGETTIIRPLKDFSPSSSKSFQICNGLFYNSQFSPALMLTYGYVFSNSNDPAIKSKKDGICEFSVNKEAKNLGVNRVSLLSHLDELNDLEVVEIYEKSGSPFMVKALVDFHKFFLNYKFPEK